MTPIAAYYLFTASEHERIAAASHGYVEARPTLMDRIRELLTGLRSQPSPA